MIIKPATTIAEFLTEIERISVGCYGCSVVMFKGDTAYSYQFNLNAKDFDTACMLLTKLFKEKLGKLH